MLTHRDYLIPFIKQEPPFFSTALGYNIAFGEHKTSLFAVRSEFGFLYKLTKELQPYPGVDFEALFDDSRFFMFFGAKIGIKFQL